MTELDKIDWESMNCLEDLIALGLGPIKVLAHLCGKKGQNSSFWVIIMALQINFTIISLCYIIFISIFQCSAIRME